ncbi:uncharacterized protein PGTG_02765 [Puccinia graminis f. sp. tritici CRL 75-36-700-3]|uniref:Tc1-like transposase DDE domain-containing protein n=1 Tax=Puccinia graminis f. sp. tritici (strain CRL 75-36-700-3 / race SCCL) TaxID=418459 RepID=E3JW99_PUCGT|nr:uncharacterized protein PGTG_02765 [Puccinia graminis f. sp. tritici CRL 75-36-700-3]EFP76324.1 hypothetical protein PGTG_02765 [Puccinia graminis f. sp. tritici CRL 75-36-700-3]
MHVIYNTQFKFQVVRAALEGSTLDEINEQHGSTIQLKLSRKTMRTVHPSQNMEDWLDYITLIAHYDPQCLVFTDESGVCSDGVVCTHGWAPVGERTQRAPHARARHRFNLVAAVALSGLVASMVQEDSMDWFDFEFNLENVLVPMMNPFPAPQSVLILDHASFHHHGRIQEIVEEKGCHIIYLPSYSPDLNPIEKGFSVFKASLRQYAELSGGEDDGDEIETFANFTFTSELIRSLFQGASYID